MLAVMPNVPVKMPFTVTTDVLASMFTMTRKYITVIVVREREREGRQRERENCTYLVLKCTAGDCRREDDRSKQFTYLLFKLFATFISYLNQISQLSNLQQFTNWLLPYEESRRML